MTLDERMKAAELEHKMRVADFYQSGCLAEHSQRVGAAFQHLQLLKEAEKFWKALVDVASPFGEQQIHSWNLMITREHVEQVLNKLKGAA